jgi:hypothetical protein
LSSGIAGFGGGGRLHGVDDHRILLGMVKILKRFFPASVRKKYTI